MHCDAVHYHYNNVPGVRIYRELKSKKNITGVNPIHQLISAGCGYWRGKNVKMGKGAFWKMESHYRALSILLPYLGFFFVKSAIKAKLYPMHRRTVRGGCAAFIWKWFFYVIFLWYVCVRNMILWWSWFSPNLVRNNQESLHLSIDFFSHFKMLAASLHV